MSTLTGQHAIARYQLVVQRKAVELEMCGFKRSGPSLASQLKRAWKLPARMKLADLLTHIDKKLADLETYCDRP